MTTMEKTAVMNQQSKWKQTDYFDDRSGDIWTITAIEWNELAGDYYYTLLNCMTDETAEVQQRYLAQWLFQLRESD